MKLLIIGTPKSLAKTLRISENTRPFNVRLPNGQSGKVVPDFLWNSTILELKTSGGAIKLEQAKRLYMLAQQNGNSLVYLFIKKPSLHEVENFSKAIRSIGGAPSALILNCIFP